MAVLVRATEPVVKPAATFVSAHWLHSGSGNSGCNTAVKCTRLGYPELSSNQRIQRMSRKRDRFSFPCDLFRSSKWPTHFFSLMLTSWQPWSPRISGGHPMWPSAGFVSAKGWPGGPDWRCVPNLRTSKISLCVKNPGGGWRFVFFGTYTTFFVLGMIIISHQLKILNAYCRSIGVLSDDLGQNFRILRVLVLVKSMENLIESGQSTSCFKGWKPQVPDDLCPELGFESNRGNNTTSARSGIVWISLCESQITYINIPYIYIYEHLWKSSLLHCVYTGSKMI